MDKRISPAQRRVLEWLHRGVRTWVGAVGGDSSGGYGYFFVGGNHRPIDARTVDVLLSRGLVVAVTENGTRRNRAAISGRLEITEAGRAAIGHNFVTAFTDDLRFGEG